jgi:hypothetical protein
VEQEKYRKTDDKENYCLFKKAKAKYTLET